LLVAEQVAEATVVVAVVAGLFITVHFPLQLEQHTQLQ
jgi:hypothetical protein